MENRLKFHITLVVILLLSCAAAKAQSLNDRSGGPVTDSSGKATSGATVTLTDR
jgi:hypothetical protein